MSPEAYCMRHDPTTRADVERRRGAGMLTEAVAVGGLG